MFHLLSLNYVVVVHGEKRSEQLNHMRWGSCADLVKNRRVLLCCCDLFKNDEISNSNLLLFSIGQISMNKVKLILVRKTIGFILQLHPDCLCVLRRNCPVRPDPALLRVYDLTAPKGREIGWEQAGT